jgi:maltooligosyltrehalose trehalohydrolase
MKDKTDLQQRQVGINFDETKQAQVRLWAPLAAHVDVELEAGTTISLDKSARGYWIKSTDQIKPNDLYKIIIDGDKKLPDPASLSQPRGVHEASAAIDLLEREWNDVEWRNHPLNNYIIYEIHTGTFSAGGNFDGIAEHLDHLVSLGINAIEIMPVAQFPGDRNWGYDGVFPYAVQHSYGGAQKLQELVEACHAKGIAIILDVVYNHVGPEGNYFAEFGPYFTEKYHTPWGQAVNFDDEYCDGVRDYFIENVLMWFRDFHIDALRMDAVHAIKDLSAVHILRAIREKVDDLMQLTGRTHYLIVECDLNDPRFLDAPEKNGFGMDSQWIDEFHHALRITAGEPATGYYSDFSGIKHLEKAYCDAYVYDGQYSEHRKKNFGLSAKGQPGSKFIVFSQNHDQVGNRMLGERSSTLYSFEMQKVLAGAVMISPFLPMLFMGEEYGETNPFLYFVSHTDPELNKMVREGRKAEFAAFHSEGEAPDPDIEHTFLKSKLQWDLLQDAKHQTMLSYYKALINLRKDNPALSNGNRNHVTATAYPDKNTLIVKRWEGKQQIVCLLNFSNQEQAIPAEDSIHNWELLFCSADEKWGGPCTSDAACQSANKLIVQAESLLIYTRKDA